MTLVSRSTSSHVRFIRSPARSPVLIANRIRSCKYGEQCESGRLSSSRLRTRTTSLSSSKTLTMRTGFVPPKAPHVSAKLNMCLRSATSRFTVAGLTSTMRACLYRSTLSGSISAATSCRVAQHDDSERPRPSMETTARSPDRPGHSGYPGESSFSISNAVAFGSIHIWFQDRPVANCGEQRTVVEIIRGGAASIAAKAKFP